MMKKVKPLLIIVAVVVISTACICNYCIVNAEEIAIQATNLEPHDPIYICGYSEFTSKNGVTSGSGTQSDPYIIENWDIDASTANGIEIRSTNVHFVIRNCVIHEGKSYYYGIYFYDVINGKIDNVTSYQNDAGIYLSRSDDNTITNCNLYSNADGIYLRRHSENNKKKTAIFITILKASI